MCSQFIAAPTRSLGAGRLETPLRDLMRPGVIVIAADASIVQLQRALLAHGVHAILVADDHGRPLGWATSRGVLAWAGRDVALHAAREAVTEPAVALEPSVTAAEAIAVLQRGEVSRLLVARGSEGLPEGVVADHDLLRVLA
jgi:CBS domain-containing protein